MLAPQSGQTRLRIAETKLMLVFLTTANEAIMSLPFCGASSPPNAQNLKRGAAGAFWGGRLWTGAAAPRFGFKSESNCVAKCFDRNERSGLTGNIEPPFSQSSRLELQIEPTKCVFKAGLGLQ
jgi:hypothetical protein